MFTLFYKASYGSVTVFLKFRLHLIKNHDVLDRNDVEGKVFVRKQPYSIDNIVILKKQTKCLILFCLYKKYSTHT